jgi:predicted YcjX-like family ATPase
LVVRQAAHRRIERVTFVATKADHVPALKRDNLCNLVRALAEPAREQQADAGAVSAPPTR